MSPRVDSVSLLPDEEQLREALQSPVQQREGDKGLDKTERESASVYLIQNNGCDTFRRLRILDTLPIWVKYWETLVCESGLTAEFEGQK